MLLTTFSVNFHNFRNHFGMCVIVTQVFMVTNHDYLMFYTLIPAVYCIKVAVNHSAHAFNCIRKYCKNKAHLINISDSLEVQ